MEAAKDMVEVIPSAVANDSHEEVHRKVSETERVVDNPGPWADPSSDEKPSAHAAHQEDPVMPFKSEAVQEPGDVEKPVHSKSCRTEDAEDSKISESGGSGVERHPGAIRSESSSRSNLSGCSTRPLASQPSLVLAFARIHSQKRLTEVKFTSKESAVSIKKSEQDDSKPDLEQTPCASNPGGSVERGWQTHPHSPSGFDVLPLD